ncbi:MAG: ABC transporter permease, partial [Caldilineaceae bacterium]
MTSTEFKLAWRNVVDRPVQTIVALLVVALAVALFVAVTHLNDGLQRGIVRASDPFGVLVVGAKGSAQQLVLSTLLLQGLPVGNIHADIYDELAQDPRAGLVVPIAMGDNVGGARIIGTSAAFFELRTDQAAGAAFRLVEGAPFAADFEAVLGATAARGLGLQLGNQFLSAHGVEQGLADDTHETPFTVVGILAESGT